MVLGRSHILRCEETVNWRWRLGDERSTSTEHEVRIGRTVTNKDYDRPQRAWLYLSICEKKLRSVMKYDDGKI